MLTISHPQLGDRLLDLLLQLVLDSCRAHQLQVILHLPVRLPHKLGPVHYGLSGVLQGTLEHPVGIQLIIFTSVQRSSMEDNWPVVVVVVVV